MRMMATILRFIGREIWRVVVAVIGFSVMAVGLVLLVTPGPGLLVIVAGLAILSTQFAWAGNSLDYAKSKAVQAKDAASRRAEARRSRMRRAIPPKSPPGAF